jgi:UDP-glucose 4-epimerase
MTAPILLVTGAAGFIGSHTVIELLAAGFNVLGLDNFSNSEEASVGRIQALKTEVLGLSAPDFKMLKVDVRDEKALNAVFQAHSLHGVVHFAGLKAVGESFEQPLRYWDNNVGGTLNLLKAMEKHGVKHLVFSSSATVYGTPKSLPIQEDALTDAVSPYGRTKWVCEQLLEEVSKANSEWNISRLRYFNPVGAHESGLMGELPNGVPNNLMPYVTQVAAGLREKLSIFGADYDTPDGTCIRDFIHVVDLAKGHVAALQAMMAHGDLNSKVLGQSNYSISGLNTFNFGTGQGVSVKELVETFESVTGQKVNHSYVQRRPGDVPAIYADPSKAKAMLGWQAARGLEQMCADAWAWQLNLKQV